MQYTYAISMVTENTLRVLQRIAGIFARQRVNIEQLNVCETSTRGTSSFNIVFHSDPKTTDRVLNQLQQIFELKEVNMDSQIPFVSPNCS